MIEALFWIQKKPWDFFLSIDCLEFGQSDFLTLHCCSGGGSSQAMLEYCNLIAVWSISGFTPTRRAQIYDKHFYDMQCLFNRWTISTANNYYWPSEHLIAQTVIGVLATSFGAWQWFCFCIKRRRMVQMVQHLSSSTYRGIASLQAT